MNPLFDLRGKVALVTGASSGMGKAIAQSLGEFGAKVVVASNDTAACEATVSEFQGMGITCMPLFFDAGHNESIDALVQATLEVYHRIDILVSGVGIAPAQSFLEMDAQIYQQVMEVNLRSAIYLTQCVLPGMQAQGGGSIFYLASIAAVRGNTHIGLYGISKAGLVQLARNLAVEYGPDNIRVNTISPGLIDTPFSEGLLAQREFMEKRLQFTPLRRVGQPNEIAGVAVLLASKAGAFITGQNIIVDGGTTISDGN